jgi:hypothetical protein
MLNMSILKEMTVLQTASPTPQAALPLPELYRRVERHIPPFEWPILAHDIAAIFKLKKERNAVVLATFFTRSPISSATAWPWCARRCAPTPM